METIPTPFAEQPIVATAEAAADVRPSVRGSINGRFLRQPVTGVQRYAREIVREIRELVGAENGLPELVVPPRPARASDDSLLPVKVVGWGSGHVWEQLSLPFGRQGMLLNLCNVGPVAVRNQIVCIHDANVFLMPASYSPMFRAAYRVLLPALGRRAAVVTTVSKTSAATLERFGIVPRGKTVVLPNGHEHVHRWHAGQSRLFDNDPPRRPFVLLIGNRARHKNAALLLRLAPSLAELGLDVFVAGGTASIFADIEAGPPPANVRLLGYISDDDLALLFRNAFCLAFPSLVEGFGLPLVEAMALGCPIIASDVSSIPEICGEAALYAPPTSPEDWLVQFRRLVCSSDLRSELIARGRERVIVYSWRESARGYLQLMH
jgi:glycosyltransferase involved in cell wall biosynthesis